MSEAIEPYAIGQTVTFTKDGDQLTGTIFDTNSVDDTLWVAVEGVGKVEIPVEDVLETNHVVGPTTARGFRKRAIKALVGKSGLSDEQKLERIYAAIADLEQAAALLEADAKGDDL